MNERCGHKNRYPRRRIAVREAKKQIADSRAEGIRLRLRCYRCNGGWYLTKQEAG